MPELPEVETVVRGLREKVSGKEIAGISCFRAGTVLDQRKTNGELGRIRETGRRGKYILIQTTTDVVIVVHLRMTGKLIYDESGEDLSSHCRAQINFRDGSRLIFDDVRTFGKIKIYDKGDEKGELEKLGLEPLSEAFSPEYLLEQLRKRKAPVKNVLLDQRVIAGLGNIYAAEILHRAGISPLRGADTLKSEEAGRIVEEMREILSEAIKKNGTTISDYRSVEDKTGEFQEFLQVYGKKHCRCGHEILKIKQAGRSTYYCPACQR